MRYPNGFPGWVDLATPDIDRATAFYGGLFGWTAVDASPAPGMTYSMLYLDEKLVCGMGPLSAEQQAAGMPSVWTSYILVGDVDEMLTAAPGAGGSVVMPAMDIPTSGRMAMVADPSGAVLGLWQPAAHQGADLFNVPGAQTWNELLTRDIAGALPFYEELFGWHWEVVPTGGMDYSVARLDAKGQGAEGVDTSVAGAMPMPPGVPEEAPSSWGVYFAVEVCDDAVAAAQSLGGSLVVGPMDMDGGRWAMLTDPLGAMFYVMSSPDTAG